MRALHLRQHPSYVEGCFGCKAASLILGVRADDDYHRNFDHVVEVDGPAYKRLRRQGYQPPAVHGSAELEARACTAYEIQRGKIYEDQRMLSEALTFCADGGLTPGVANA